MRKKSTGILIALSLILLLPLLGAWARRGQEEGCAFDGVRIQPIYRVRIEGEGDKSHAFCCVDCASHWLDLQKARRREIFVTDEQSGQEISASTAYFVRSLVITMPVSGNRVHVFKSRVDAESHARLCRGTMLTNFELSNLGGKRK